MNETLYQVLGVTQKATPDEISAAFERRCEACTLSIAQGDTTAQNTLYSVKAAYEFLSNLEKRRVYDDKLAAKQYQPRPITIGQAARAHTPARTPPQAASVVAKLANCPVCKKEVSRSAPVCPHCGEPSPVTQHIAVAQGRPQVGAKTGAIGSILTLIFIFIALKSCGGSTDQSLPLAPLPSSSPPSESQREALMETTAFILNANALLCAKVQSIKPVSGDLYEVTCVEYRNGTGEQVYHMDATKGRAWKPS